MPRALLVRPEGSPFATRTSRVLCTILDAGWDCDILIHEGGLGRLNEAAAMGRDLRAEVAIHEFSVRPEWWHRVARQASGANYFGTAELRQSLAELVSRRPYDLIIVKDSPSLGSVFAALDRTPHARIPVACEMVEPRVAQAYDSLVRYGTLTTRITARARRILPRLRDVERRYLPRCDRVFVVVDEMKAWLLDTYPLDPARVAVVQNVEVLSQFDSIDEPGVPPRRATRVSFVGSFGPHRGIELLIEAAGLVRRGQPGPPIFQLAIVVGSAADMRRIERLCGRFGVGDIAELAPYAPHRLAMQWIKETDIGVIPHLDTPGIRTTVPFKLFQYLAAGAACLVSDVGPLGRIVRESEAGLAFRPGSTTDLAERLAYLLGHPAEARAMGANGRRRSELSLRWEVESREYTQYLGSLATAAVMRA